MALTDSLIAHWKLDEASGTRVDAHGANDLTDNNTVVAATGKIGDAADFERDNSEWLSLSSNADVQTGNIDVTFAAWVKLESKPAGNMIILQKTTSTRGEYFLAWIQASDRFGLDVFGSIDFGDPGSVVANNLGAPSTATWYFVVAWHDATANTLNIQVNNGTVDSVSHTAGIYVGAGEFQISDDVFDGFWDGLTDSTSMWKRVLTSDERTSLYNSGNGLDYDDFDAGAAVVSCLALLGVG